jgi:hypothetical protein
MLKNKTVASNVIVKAEKNLVSLGFFTPSSKRIKKDKEKTIVLNRLLNGKKVATRATVVPGAIYGLPVTADQDKYLALQKIINDRHRSCGEVRNPIGFTSSELLKLLNKHAKSGRNHEHISEWLDVMSATTIISEDVVYLARKRAWVRDRFRVFDRAVSFGKEMEDGKAADRNYVWLSQWQLENINNHHVVPIDLKTYVQLRNHVSKALVPLLQIWLYASREDGYFEKRYDELCRILSLRQYCHTSKIKEKLSPSFDELVAYGYLSDWQLTRTSDGENHKLILRHGRRFRCNQGQQPTENLQVNHSPTEQRSRESSDPRHGLTIDPALLEELVKRGIPESQAQKLLSNLAPGQRVMDQIEWGDYSIRQKTGSKITNPTGFYIYLIRENTQPPETFASSRIKRLRDEASQSFKRQQQERDCLALAYDDYRNHEIDAHIATHYSEAKFQDLLEKKRQELEFRYRQMGRWKPETLAQFLQAAVRTDIEKKLTFLTFEEFVESEYKRSGPSLLSSDSGVNSKPPVSHASEASAAISSRCAAT